MPRNSNGSANLLNPTSSVQPPRRRNPLLRELPLPNSLSPNNIKLPPSAAGSSPKWEPPFWVLLLLPFLTVLRRSLLLLLNNPRDSDSNPPQLKGETLPLIERLLPITTTTIKILLCIDTVIILTLLPAIIIRHFLL